MTTKYEKIAGLVSHIRNARFGEMVKYSEELIESGAWQDFTTPAGTRFQFRSCEYDYFLAVEDIDPLTLRHAYIHAAPMDKQLRLADISGRGPVPTNEDRRQREEVVRQYLSDPSGASARIEAWAKEALVPDTVSRIANDPARRQAAEAGEKVLREHRQTWRVRWSDDSHPADVIVAKLLEDPDLAHEVWKRLHATRQSVRDHEQRRRSQAQNGQKKGPTLRVVA